MVVIIMAVTKSNVSTENPEILSRPLNRSTGTQCGLEFCWLCGATYSSMKKNGREAHRPDCYWHAEFFNLWKRSPRRLADSLPDWKGTPDLGHEAGTRPDAKYHPLSDEGIAKDRRDRAKRARIAEAEAELHEARENADANESKNASSPGPQNDPESSESTQED